MKSISDFNQKVFVPTFLSKDEHGNPCHIYQDDAGNILPSVTSILKDALGTYRYKSSGPSYAATRGTAVHLACQYYDEKDLVERDLDPVIRPYLEQYKRAIAAHNIVVEANELMRYHNLLLYAGSIDKIARVDSPTRRSIIDIKTSKAKDAWHKWQVAAYAEMVKHELGELDRYCLYLSPESYCLVQHTGKTDGRDFRLLLADLRIWENDEYNENESAIIKAANTLKRNSGYLNNIRALK